MEQDQTYSFTIYLLVANQFGVLTRVAGLFSKRGFNIDELHVAPTKDRRISRMAVVSSGDDYIREQMVKQLEKLVNVKVALIRLPDCPMTAQLLRVRADIPQGRQSAALALLEPFRLRVTARTPASLYLETIGEPEEIDAFLATLGSYPTGEQSRIAVAGPVSSEKTEKEETK